MMVKKKKRLNLSLDQDTIDRIRLISLERHMNMSEVITKLIWTESICCKRITALTAEGQNERRTQD